MRRIRSLRSIEGYCSKAMGCCVGAVSVCEVGKLMVKTKLNGRLDVSPSRRSGATLNSDPLPCMSLGTGRHPPPPPPALFVTLTGEF